MIIFDYIGELLIRIFVYLIVGLGILLLMYYSEKMSLVHRVVM